MPSLRSLLALVLAAASTAAAAPLDARADRHEADFRTFGVAGCSAENQGVYTLTETQAGACLSFAGPFGSLLVVDNACTLTLYHDTLCSQSPMVAPTGICQNGRWLSYRMTC